MKHYLKNSADESDLVREKFLTDEERFLVSFLHEFNRARTKEWNNRGLWKTVYQNA